MLPLVTRMGLATHWGQWIEQDVSHSGIISASSDSAVSPPQEMARARTISLSAPIWQGGMVHGQLPLTSVGWISAMTRPVMAEMICNVRCAGLVVPGNE